MAKTKTKTKTKTKYKIRSLVWKNHGDVFVSVQTSVGNVMIYVKHKSYTVHRSLPIVSGSVFVKFIHPAFDTLNEAKAWVEERHNQYLKEFLQ